MEAYQFIAKPENGVIHIPIEYKHKIKNTVRVILIEEKPFVFDRDEANARHKSDLLLSPTMSTKGWRFSREQANER